MIPKINSAHGSDTRNIINRTIEVLNHLGIDVQTLVAEGQLTPQEFAELITIVNGNIKRGEVTVHDINKNKGLIDESYLSDTLKQQMAGNTPIHSIPAPKSVTIGQTAFYERTSNLFNKNDVTLDVYLASDGSLTDADGWVTSGFISVKPNTDYIAKSLRHVAYYDEQKNLIERIFNEENPFSTPESTMYVRFSWTGLTDVPPDAQQLNEGTALVGYEAYKEFIPAKYIEPQFNPDYVEDGSLPISKMMFAQSSKNLFSPNEVEIDTTLSATTGATSEAADWITSGFIPIKPNTDYFIKYARRMAMYDENKAFIQGISFENPYTDLTFNSSANAHFFRLTSYKHPISEQMVNEGKTAIPFEPFGAKIKKDVLPLELGESEPDEILLPSKLYGLVGQELNIYFDNIIKGDAKDYNFDVNCSIGAHFEDFFRVTPTSAGTFPITIQVYKENTEVALATSEIIVSASNVGDGAERNIIVIGDSTTAGSATMQRFHENFDGDVMNVNTLGTRGTSPYSHEGRSGWTARQYVTVAEDHIVPDLINAFWNPNTAKFDFSYYMSTNGYSSVDYVVLNLGINDTFSHTDDDSLQERIDEFLSQYQEMIASIHAYDSTIKIGVALTIPPHYSQDAFARSYRNGQTRWRYKRNNFFLVKSLIETFNNKESNNIYLVPINTNLDTKYNFPIDHDNPTVPVNARNPEITVTNPAANAGVHPTTSGYWQIVDVYWYWLKSFES